MKKVTIISLVGQKFALTFLQYICHCLYQSQTNFTVIFIDIYLRAYLIIFFQTSTTGEVLLPTDKSSPPSPLSVTGSASSGEAKLHLIVHKEGSYIQIGQSCMIVEMHITDQTLERLKAQGTLQSKHYTLSSQTRFLDEYTRINLNQSDFIQTEFKQDNILHYKQYFMSFIYFLR